MGNEGQNIPNNTSGAERKRPWEIFSEEEKESIRKEIKHLDRNKKKKQKISKCKAAFIDIKKFGRRHKIIYIICILIFSASIMSVGFFSTSLLVKMISNDNIENAEALEEEPQNSKDNIFNGITLKNAPNPNMAHAFAMNRISPILLEGALDTGTINFSKIEDNYNVFEKTLDNDYEKVCFYLAMIDSMFALESDFGSARAAYLLERFDEKKIKLDDTQYYFYLSTHIKYALYKKDEFLTKKYRDEFNNKYSAINNNYFGLDDEEFIFDEEEL